MKKIAYTVSVLGLLLAAAPAYAAVLTVSPASVAVSAGQKVTLNLVVDSEGATIVTVKSQLSYPADILEFSSFSFAQDWIPLSQTGFDSMSAGSITKTAGFPNGFTGTRTFATVSFVAKKAGTAEVSATDGSLVLGSAGQSALGSRNSSRIAVAEAPAPVATAPSQAALTAGVVLAATSAPAAVEATSSQAAAAATTGATIPSWLWLLILLAILAAGGGWYWYNTKKPTTPKA